MIWYNDNYGQNKIRIYGEEQNMMFEVHVRREYMKQLINELLKISQKHIAT